MRYSEQERQSPTRVAAKQSNEDFFARVAKACDGELGRGAILLVGARDFRARSVRQAQAVLRYDRRASYFSHAALIARWEPKRPGSSVGLEVAIDAAQPEEQVPERNGVTRFRLSRYFDKERYPNLAVLAMALKPMPHLDADGTERSLSGAERKQRLLAAAQNPNRQREVYPMWDALSTWSSYTLAPEVHDNPLQNNVPHPGAALCEYAYAAAEIDIVPGATTSHSCPELLWATANRWRESLATTAKSLRAYCIIRDEHSTPPDPLSMEIPL